MKVVRKGWTLDWYRYDCPKCRARFVLEHDEVPLLNTNWAFEKCPECKADVNRDIDSYRRCDEDGNV